MPNLTTFAKPFGSGNRFGTMFTFKLYPTGALGESSVFDLLGLKTMAAGEQKAGRLDMMMDSLTSVRGVGLKILKLGFGNLVQHVIFAIGPWIDFGRNEFACFSSPFSA